MLPPCPSRFKGKQRRFRGLFFSGCRGCRQWQDDAHAGAAGRRARDVDVAAMQVHDLLHEVEAKPRTLAVLAQALERLEDALGVVRRDAGATVRDAEGNLLSFGSYPGS